MMIDYIRFVLYLFISINETLAQNGQSFTKNCTSLSENNYLNSSEVCNMSPLSGNLHTMMTAAPKITTFDQHTNPFVFKCELNFFRKIRVSIYSRTVNNNNE